MALNKQALENDLRIIFDLSNKTPRQQNSITIESSAQAIIDAFISYIRNATVVLTAPGIQPSVPPVPDPSFPLIGQELSPDTINIGKEALVLNLVSAMIAAAPGQVPVSNPSYVGWPLFVTGFSAYLLSLISWSGGGYIPAPPPSAVVVTRPINITQVHKSGISANSVTESARLLADEIHSTVTTTTVAGTFAKGVYVGAVLAATTIG